MDINLATAPRGELVKLIYRLLDENESLKAAMAEIQEQKSQQEEKKRLVASFVKANIRHKKSKKKRKQRVHGFSRKREYPTSQVFHSLEICPQCQSKLGMPSVSYSRQIIDIPIRQYEVIEHVVFKRYCFNCHKRFAPKVDLSSYVLGKGRIGINLMAYIFTLRQDQDMTLSKIQSNLKTTYGLELSEGEIIEVLHAEAKLGEADYESIRRKLLASSVIYADETGGREDGINGYHWSFSNERFMLLLYRKSRSAKVVAQVLGEDGKDFNGVLGSDFYSGYNEYAGYHQRCWVHYLRDINNLQEENPKDRKLKRWINQIHAIYNEAKDYPGPAPNLPIGLKDKERMEKEEYFKQKLRTLCEPYVKTQLPQAKLSARAIRFISEMFTFIRFEGVNPDNNMAERAIRKTVIKRKISYGTRSAKGSETNSILGSLFGTWHLQHLNPFEQMKLLLLRASCQEV